MSILHQLATSLDSPNDKPNQELAKKLIRSGDQKAIRELVENLHHKDKNIQSDCIKVLYEIGEQKAELIAQYDKEFLDLLENKNNRLVWGAMTALDGIADINPKGIYKNLSRILAASDTGSVITKDHAVNILIKLGALKAYSENSLALLLDEFKTSPTNQLPTYAEKAFSIIPEKQKAAFAAVFTARMKDFEKETKKKRLEKVIQKLR